MARTVSYRWHLRELMATRGMFSTTDLHPHLAERAIQLSPSQVHRMVTGTPERLSLPILAALCDILDCTPNDLIEPYVQTAARNSRKAAGAPRSQPGPASQTPLRPKRARIVDSE